jgi:charged multivesicular body protein 3
MFGRLWFVSAVNLEGTQLEVATKKAQQQVKQLATKGDVKNARVLAREVVRSHKQKDRLSVSKARLGSISHQLQQQLGAVLRIFVNCLDTHT